MHFYNPSIRLSAGWVSTGLYEEVTLIQSSSLYEMKDTALPSWSGSYTVHIRAATISDFHYIIIVAKGTCNIITMFIENKNIAVKLILVYCLFCLFPLQINYTQITSNVSGGRERVWLYKSIQISVQIKCTVNNYTWWIMKNQPEELNGSTLSWIIYKIFSHVDN